MRFSKIDFSDKKYFKVSKSSNTAMICSTFSMSMKFLGILKLLLFLKYLKYQLKSSFTTGLDGWVGGWLDLFETITNLSLSLS